jgi:hypothetical protein
MDSLQGCITSTRSNVRPPGGGGAEVMLYSAGGVETVRLKHFHQIHAALYRRMVVDIGRLRPALNCLSISWFPGLVHAFGRRSVGKQRVNS